MATVPNVHPSYPVRVDARLEPELSRWLWLVKWFLAIPHYFVLAFLWIAFFVSSVIAFFSILFTGRYPRSIFAFNVGVMRWTWRVAYYAYGALGTDRYPPFSLEDDPDYPAHLEIAYPEQLSRGLVLVKWWLLAIPHYIIVGLLVGGTWIVGRQAWPNMGLIGILVFVSAVVLAFTGRYPSGLFDLILGLNRWVLRVAAYSGLMTDEYPPFRLDVGGSEQGSTLTLPRPPEAPTPMPAGPPPAEPHRSGWTGGMIASLVIGSLMLLGSLAPVIGGSVGLWLDQARRDSAGFVTFGPENLSTSTYALTTEQSDFVVEDTSFWFVRSAVGTVRVRETPTNPGDNVFVGIARKADIARYLGGVNRTSVSDLAGANRYRVRKGGAPASPPAQQSFWATSSSGSGTQAVKWTVDEGSWGVVVMKADATKGVHVRADVGVTAPALLPVSIGLVAGGVVFFAIGMVMVVIPIRKVR